MSKTILYARVALIAMLLLAFQSCDGNEPSGVSIRDLITQIRGALEEINQAIPPGLPPLSKVTLTLETFAKKAAEGNIELYVVTADGSVSESDTQTITISLEPPEPPKVKAVSSLRPNLKEMLSKAIIDAAEEASAALQDQNKLSLTELTATVKFVVEISGGVGVNIEILPVKAGITGSGERSITNTIEVTFKAPEGKQANLNSSSKVPELTADKERNIKDLNSRDPKSTN